MLVLPCQAREKGLLLDRQCVTYKRQAAWSPFPRPAGSEGGVGVGGPVTAAGGLALTQQGDWEVTAQPSPRLPHRL